LACPQGLAISQTDRFDTPYNEGIPPAYHQKKANHWHAAAETVKRSSTTRIAAVMAVSGARERFEVKLQKQDGWFGAAASGDFGAVEGWIRIGDVTTLPKGFAGRATDERINICGRSRDGELCFA
jgi:hypothetical protein